MISAVFGNIIFSLETELTATTSVNRLCIDCVVLRASGRCILAASVFKVAIDKISAIIYIRTTFKDEPLYRLALFHSPTGAAWCFPSIQPLLSRSTLQHDHWNPLMNSSYSINVHASPSTSGSKSSHTSWSGLISRLPCVTCQCFASNDRTGGKQTTYQGDKCTPMDQCSRHCIRGRSCGTASLPSSYRSLDFASG